MEKKYGIGFFAVVLVLVTALSFAYRAEYKYAEERADAAKEQEEEKKKEEQAVSTQGDAKKEEIYYLAELNGYVVVYLHDRQTVFEYTNIRLSELPEELQEEISGGKVIEGTEKLYGFLENYSS